MKKLCNICGFMVADENMESIMRNLVNTYFEKVKERTREGKGIVEIINENLADNAELMIQVDMIREQTNKENYWENITKIAELARKYGKDKGNDFYCRMYDTIVEITQECFEDDRVYTVDDLNAFQLKMQGVYDIAQMPEYMMGIGKTPDKMFLLAATAHAREGEKNFPDQMIGLLQIIKNGDLNLGSATNDLEDFCMQIGNAYEEIKLSGTEEQRREFQELFLHNFMLTNNLQATNIKIRKSQFEFERNNAYLEAVQDDILADPEFYIRKEKDENGQEISNIENLLRVYPRKFLGEIKRNRAFLKMFATQALGERSEGLDEFFDLEDIKKQMLEKKGYSLEDIYSFDYSDCDEFVPTILKQEARDMLEEGITKIKAKLSFGFDTKNNAETIMAFGNVGEEEFAREQTEKLFGKIAEVYTPDVSIEDKSQIALAIITLTNSEVGFAQNNPEIFEDAVNGLKQYTIKNRWTIRLVREQLLKLGEKNPEALRILEFIEKDGVVEYSQMAQEPILTPKVMQKMAQKPILTPAVMRKMAQNPEVQVYIPDAGEVMKELQKMKKEQVVEH